MAKQILIITSYHNKTAYIKTNNYTDQIRTFGVAAIAKHAFNEIK